MKRIPIRIPAGFRSEYTVYVYHWPENHLEGQGDWEKRGVTADLHAALREARRLYGSRNFRCVEIKRHLFRPLLGKRRTEVTTLRTFGGPAMTGEENTWWLPVAMSAAIVFMAALALLQHAQGMA